MPIQQQLTRANRQGTVVSALYNVPVAITGEIQLKADISQADLNDPLNTLDFKIERFDSQSGLWVTVAGCTWEGGPNTSWKDPQPGVAFNASEVAGQQVRISLSIPRTMRIGASVEVV